MDFFFFLSIFFYLESMSKSPHHFSFKAMSRDSVSTQCALCFWWSEVNLLSTGKQKKDSSFFHFTSDLVVGNVQNSQLLL